MGEGGVHETDPRPRSQPRTTHRIGRTVSLHPQGAAQDSRPDGLARCRARPDRKGDLRDRPRQRGDGASLAETLPGRGGRGSARRTATGSAVQGDSGVPRGADPRGPPPSPQPGVAVLCVDPAAAGRLHGRKHGHPGELRDGAGTPEERRDSTQPPPAHHHESRSRVRPQKRRSRRLATASTLQTTSTMPTSST